MPRQSAALNAFDMRSSTDVFQSPTTMEKCLWNIKNRPLVFLLILLLVVLGIGALIYYFTMSNKSVTYKPLDKDELFGGKYEPQLFNGTWVQGDSILMKDADKNIVLFDVKNLNTILLANVTTKNLNNSYHFDLSADKQYLLLGHHSRKIYRHSFLAYYDIINIETGEQFTLKHNSSDKNPWDLQLAQWSPVGHSLVVVSQNNIYYIQDFNNQSSIQLTKSGGPDFYNGIPDWVYEEEVFSSNSATWFSKQGTRIAYASFNDTLVPTMEIPVYGVTAKHPFQYPNTVRIHYPKVGTHNPHVQLFVQRLDVITEPPIPILPPRALSSVTKQIILNTVIWSDDSTLFGMWMNRIQNQSYLVQYSGFDSPETIQERIVEFRQPGGWLDFSQLPLVGDQHRLAIIFPAKQPNGDYFKHLVVVEPDNKLTTLTSGNFEVLELLKWDVPTNYIYYLANTEKNPEELYMYRVLAKEQSSPECISCKTDTECKNNKAVMSVENNYYAHVCLGPNVPEVKIIETTGKEVMKWEMNESLKNATADINLPRVSFIYVPTSDGLKALVRLIIPRAVDENADVKYPLLVHTYAGPGSNLAINKFSVDWNMFLSSTENMIIAEIDGRGSGRRGNNITFATYLKLGTYEIEDQILVTSYLQKQFTYIDKSKTAIWGWSYGGYTSAMALSKDDTGVFKCGLSVAPVTDWFFYDSIYTERYMGLIQHDSFKKDYTKANLLKYADKFKNKKYMIIHGTFDDNVHFQQSLVFSYELERRAIPFRQQFYADESHGLVYVRQHMYETLGSFFFDCFHDRL